MNMGEISFKKGLSNIPKKIKSKLPPHLVKSLELDGYGISFPESSGLQMRFLRDGKDLGGFYSYLQFGGVKKACEAAISRNMQLRAAIPRIIESPFDGVYWVERNDKRKGKIEYTYRVNYKKPDGSKSVRSFGFGHKMPSPDKQLHGFRTAKLFRYMDSIGELDYQWFNRWKHVRLYTSTQDFFDWESN